MHHEVISLGFPLWLRIAHFINLLFVILLIRSGIQILSDHPKFYWNVHCALNSEWISFGRKRIEPRQGIWTSMDEAVAPPAWLALPGGYHNLGMGRHWHFFSVFFWVTTGWIYVLLLFITGEWRRLLPASWEVIPGAINTFITYATFHLPPPGEFHPYDPLQQLTYAFVVFILSPLMILTGVAMSPAVDANFPWYPRLFGNRQIARSIHFILTCILVVFIVIHVALVVLTGFSENMNHMVLGGISGGSRTAVAIGLFAIAFVVLVNVLATWMSHKYPRLVAKLTGPFIDLTVWAPLDSLKSRQEYSKDEISPYFWINGRPPDTDTYRQLVATNFQTWRLEIHGLVENPVSLSLPELHKLPRKSQITMHHCIQGWSGIAEWTGVPLGDLMSICKPFSNARYVVFHSYELDEKGREYYGTLSLDDVRHPQSIIAYEMNGLPLPVPYGAPARLRCESKLGFKMVKYLRSIEIVEDYATVGGGYGGYREDNEYYGTIASI